MEHLVTCNSCGRDVCLKKEPVDSKAHYCYRCIGYGKDNLPNEQRDRSCIPSQVLGGSAEMLGDGDDEPWYEREDGE